MYTPHLVGIQHNVRLSKDGKLQSPGYLLSNSCAEKFRELILPQLNSGSVLFPEGRYENDVITPGDRRYNALCSGILGNIVGLTKTGVSLCFADARSQLSSSQQTRYFQNMLDFSRYCTAYIEVKKNPTTTDELITMVRENEVSYKIMNEPTWKIKRLANDLVKAHDTWTALMIKRLTAITQLGCQCFLVAGVAHCVDVHIKGGWPIQLLVDTTDLRKLRELFFGTITVPCFGRAIRGY